MKVLRQKCLVCLSKNRKPVVAGTSGRERVAKNEVESHLGSNSPVM